MTQAADLFADPSWRLDALDLNSRQAVFLRIGREALARAPFLDGRLDRSGLEQARLPLDALMQAPAAPRPPAFIWHSAFCGSTLLTHALTASGRALGLSEPIVLEALSSLLRHGHRQAFDALLRPCLDLLAKPFSAEERIVIKPTNAVANLIAPVRALSPDAPSLFLTSEPRAFLTSVAKKGEEGRGFARRFFHLLKQDHDWSRALDAQAPGVLTDLQVAALLHLVTTDLMRRAGGGAAWLDGDMFLVDPAPALRALDAHFDLGAGTDAMDAVAASDLFTADVKTPGRAYTAADRASEAQALEREYGADLDTVMDWLPRAAPPGMIEAGRLVPPAASLLDPEGKDRSA